MLKYRGQYRVVYERDVRTGKHTEFTFIPCRIKKGANIYRHDNDVLSVYIPSAIIANRLLKDHVDIFKPFQMGDTEAALLFPESLLYKAVEILKPYVQGANISPRAKRNARYI